MRGSSNARSDAQLPIHVAPVPHPDDIHHPLSIIEALHDSVVPDPDTPELLGALQLLRSWRARVAREALDPSQNAGAAPWVESFQLASRRTGEGDGILSHFDGACPGG